MHVHLIFATVTQVSYYCFHQYEDEPQRESMTFLKSAHLLEPGSGLDYLASESMLLHTRPLFCCA